jgi:hypothetical protein
VPFRAVSDYASNKPNILSIKKGDIIIIVDRTRQDWWRGTLNGAVGAVPATYLRPVENEAPVNASAPVAAAAAAAAAPVVDEAAERKARRSTIVASPDVAAKMRAAADAAKAQEETGVALYTFTQAKPGVLLFEKGSILTILDKSRPDWWKAEQGGKIGLVPAKYIQLRPRAAAAPVQQPVQAQVQVFGLFSAFG